MHGRFTDYAGQIVYDPANLALSKADVTIRDTSIYTANERRDGHLRTQDFFWTEKYPTIAFHSTKVIPGADSTHFQVVGNLTIRDVTKPVTLAVEFLGMAPVVIGGNSIGTARSSRCAKPSCSRYAATPRATKPSAGRSRTKVSVTRNDAVSITSAGGFRPCL